VGKFNQQLRASALGYAYFGVAQTMMADHHS